MVLVNRTPQLAGEARTGSRFIVKSDVDSVLMTIVFRRGYRSERNESINTKLRTGLLILRHKESSVVSTNEFFNVKLAVRHVTE